MRHEDVRDGSSSGCGISNGGGISGRLVAAEQGAAAREDMLAMSFHEVLAVVKFSASTTMYELSKAAQPGVGSPQRREWSPQRRYRQSSSDSVVLSQWTVNRMLHARRGSVNATGSGKLGMCCASVRQKRVSRPG